MKSSGIGGQAVLEGVMMRYKSNYAVAVRRPDGEIAVTRGKCKTARERSVFFRLPIIRGIVAFCESLSLGMRTLTYSASFYEEEEERKEEAKKGSGGDMKEKVQMGITIVLSVVFAVFMFMLLPYFLSQMLSKQITSYPMLAAIEGGFRVVLFVGYVIAISFMRDIHRTFMYHGAEHKSINCIENGLELTVENVRRQSKHHRRCGTSFLLIVIFLSILLFMFIHFDNLWLRLISRIILIPVIAGISYEFIRFAGNSDSKIVAILCKPGMWLQMLTTREPDNKMIEVAIASIEEVFDWREYQRRTLAARRREARFGRGRRTEEGKRKSRAELAEEIRLREEANARRANERARRMMEQERKEAELERLADEAEKRTSERVASVKKPEVRQVQKQEPEHPDDFLRGLDHYFDGRQNNRGNK
ncbi:MAG: DUF1385 domain-containing protein [Lachnospiraceae bacterium]|nr:DUF1385 domain-containing protein [Lachnospiraceae bacterium]